MSKRIILSNKSAAPVGPYSQGVAGGGFIFTAGQIPLDVGGNLVPGGIKEQTEQVLQNLRNVLEAGGSSLDKVLKCTVYLKDLADFAGMNEIYAKHFTANYPARTTIQIARIPKDCLVEIEAVALI